MGNNEEALGSASRTFSPSVARHRARVARITLTPAPPLTEQMNWNGIVMLEASAWTRWSPAASPSPEKICPSTDQREEAPELNCFCPLRTLSLRWRKWED